MLYSSNQALQPQCPFILPLHFKKYLYQWHIYMSENSNWLVTKNSCVLSLSSPSPIPLHRSDPVEIFSSFSDLSSHCWINTYTPIPWFFNFSFFTVLFLWRIMEDLASFQVCLPSMPHAPRTVYDLSRWMLEWMKLHFMTTKLSLAAEPCGGLRLHFLPYMVLLFSWDLVDFLFHCTIFLMCLLLNYS